MLFSYSKYVFWADEKTTLGESDVMIVSYCEITFVT